MGVWPIIPRITASRSGYTRNEMVISKVVCVITDYPDGQLNVYRL